MSVSASHTPQAGYMASTTMRQFRSRVAPLDLMLGQQSVADISSAEQVLSAPPAGAAGPLCWAHGLPTHLIELILIHLRDMTGDGRKDLFAASGVCTSWRRIATELYFPSPWITSPALNVSSASTPATITHPAQLFALCPRQLPSLEGGLLRCFVRRVPMSHKGSRCRFTLHQGADYSTPMSSSQPAAHFLMAAQQTSKRQYLLSLAPEPSDFMNGLVAVLQGNLARTRYTLMPASGCGMRCTLTRAGYPYHAPQPPPAPSPWAPVPATAAMPSARRQAAQSCDGSGREHDPWVTSAHAQHTSVFSSSTAPGMPSPAGAGPGPETAEAAGRAPSGPSFAERVSWPYRTGAVAKTLSGFGFIQLSPAKAPPSTMLATSPDSLSTASSRNGMGSMNSTRNPIQRSLSWAAAATAGVGAGVAAATAGVGAGVGVGAAAGVGAGAGAGVAAAPVSRGLVRAPFLPARASAALKGAFLGTGHVTDGAPVLMRLMYQMRVRGIMLPRRMKLELPAPVQYQSGTGNPAWNIAGFPATDGGQSGGAYTGIPDGARRYDNPLFWDSTAAAAYGVGLDAHRTSASGRVSTSGSARVARAGNEHDVPVPSAAQTQGAGTSTTGLHAAAAGGGVGAAAAAIGDAVAAGGAAAGTVVEPIAAGAHGPMLHAPAQGGAGHGPVLPVLQNESAQLAEAIRQSGVEARNQESRAARAALATQGGATFDLGPLLSRSSFSPGPWWHAPHHTDGGASSSTCGTSSNMPHAHGLPTLETGGMGDLHAGLELPMQERHPHLQYDNVLVHADAMDGLPAVGFGPGLGSAGASSTAPGLLQLPPSLVSYPFSPIPASALLHAASPASRRSDCGSVSHSMATASSASSSPSPSGSPYNLGPSSGSNTRSGRLKPWLRGGSTTPRPAAGSTNDTAGGICGIGEGNGSAGVRHTGGAMQTPRRVVKLASKPPHWNDNLRCWCLNFRGRVKVASVKNFQLASPQDSSLRIMLQFGKVETDLYILDYDPCVMTCAQAFAASLSSFEAKLLI